MKINGLAEQTIETIKQAGIVHNNNMEMIRGIIDIGPIAQRVYDNCQAPYAELDRAFARLEILPDDIRQKYIERVSK